ncbi:hypothetical protein [Umezawaea tangerina]|uniref:hypothetical protein n=1 Tax=Umezawaea tangerina TaxID=84725 RepID=UPI000D068D1E|nr:hypothetical protein [Umezawaea tangerina]
MSTDENSQQDLFSGLADLRQRDGRLHLTTSLLISHEALQDELAQRLPGLTWNKEHVGELRGHQDSKALSRAIEPLFNDIADRKRGLFVEDFLIDTESIVPRDGYGPNVCDIIDIEMPDRVSWSTEGRDLRADLDRHVRFESVRCRAFWVAHSNLSLSYHLSFELTYQHSASHYYALSLLQKVFFPTEGTSAMYESDEASPVATSRRDRQSVARSLPEYVRHRFQLDSVDLFDTIRTTAKTKVTATGDPQLSKTFFDPERVTATDAADSNTTCVTVLEDPYFFRLLDQDIRERLTDLDAVDPVPTEDGVLVYRREVLDRCHPDHLAYYFLSGYFQNIIDFFRQDLSEIQDSTDPIYPPSGVQDDSGYFIVYATPASLYEVVSRSRSLNAGRGWIGTCPYLFLVHLMTLHNEDLVRRYENQVRELIRHLDDVGLLDPGDRLGRWRGDETFDRFRRFRLTTFQEVQRHRYFNVLRYDTERAFYESIEEVRGIRQREEYWAEVVADLERTVDDLRDARQRHVDGRRNKLLGAVTVIGVLQVAFQGLDFAFEMNAAKIGWAAALTSGAVVLATRVFLSKRGSEP